LYFDFKKPLLYNITAAKFRIDLELLLSLCEIRKKNNYELDCRLYVFEWNVTVVVLGSAIVALCVWLLRPAVSETA